MQENDFQKLISELKKTGGNDRSAPDAIEHAVKNLSETQKSKMDAVLRDPEKLRQLLESPIAKKILSDLQK